LWEERRLRVFQIRVLRRIFGSKRDEVTGEWRKLHNEELNVLYPSPSTVQAIKPKKKRWAGHVALMGRGEACTGVWWGKLGERGFWGDRGVDGRTILRWIFRK
jgi:hypothetical protein